MAKFRKKPIVVEATQWFKNGDHPEVSMFPPKPHRPNESCLNCGHVGRRHGWIDTLEGGHLACPGDWIITGVQGEHYPCKPDIFKQTYEPVE